jgi:DNA-binding transcriptional ArsR family regulator
MDGFDAARLDDAIHGKMRLAIMAYLSGAEQASFTALRDAVGASDGNVSTHLRKLEEAGHVALDKRFEGRKPLTIVRMTEGGRAAWLAYLDQLRRLLD